MNGFTKVAQYQWTSGQTKTSYKMTINKILKLFFSSLQIIFTGCFTQCQPVLLCCSGEHSIVVKGLGSAYYWDSIQIHILNMVITVNRLWQTVTERCFSITQETWTFPIGYDEHVPNEYFEDVIKKISLYPRRNPPGPKHHNFNKITCCKTTLPNTISPVRGNQGAGRMPFETKWRIDSPMENGALTKVMKGAGTMKLVIWEKGAQKIVHGSRELLKILKWSKV